MPTLLSGKINIDYTDDGEGTCVVLVHSSVSGSRQWHALVDVLKERYRVLAVNLFGYGETTPWSSSGQQSLYAQAQLVFALCGNIEGPIHLVGHSFGGSVALKAAAIMNGRVEKLVLLEPNPFFLLRQHGRTEAYLESRALRDHVKFFGSVGNWENVAERFANYWLGAGSWESMPEKRRVAFAASCAPNFYEWDAVMDEETTLEQWKEIPARTLVVSAKETVRPIREIIELLAGGCPNWSFVNISEGGHMAPLTHPELVNPIVRQFLDGENK